MSALWWRIRYMFSVSWILRDTWILYRFKFYLGLGWHTSRLVKKNNSPYQKALNEITKWYTE
jgi:hypothetical protein